MLGLIVPAVLESVAHGSTCKCSGESTPPSAAVRADYGSQCWHWDAQDEKPWCAVARNACGDDTFRSSSGHYWAHKPCDGIAAKDLPPLPSTASSSRSSWDPAAWLARSDGSSVSFLPPVGVWRDNFVQAKPQPWYGDYRKFQAELLHTMNPGDCGAARWAALHVPPTYGITANFMEHVFLDFLSVVLNGTTPVITGGDDQWAAADIGMESELCPWWKGVMSVNLTHPAGQAYYDSIYAQYADWGVVSRDSV